MGFILGDNRWPKRAGTWRPWSFFSRWKSGAARGPARDAVDSRGGAHRWQSAHSVARPQTRTCVVRDEPEIRATLAELGIDYERWDLSACPVDAPAEAVLAAFAAEIDEMKRRGGYMTADVIDVNPQTPGLDAMLARFDKEHTHSEDEVRFILAGRGIFFLNLDEKSSPSKLAPATCCASPAEPRIGSRSAKTAASAPFAGFRTRPDGRRTIPTQASIALISRSASDRNISARACTPRSSA